MRLGVVTAKLGAERVALVDPTEAGLVIRLRDGVEDDPAELDRVAKAIAEHLAPHLEHLVRCAFENGEPDIKTFGVDRGGHLVEFANA